MFGEAGDPREAPGLPCSPVVKTLLPAQAAKVCTLVGGLKFHTQSGKKFFKCFLIKKKRKRKQES